jgi:hypothetical protein
MVLFAGDFNEDSNIITRRLERVKDLFLWDTVGSSYTRFPKFGRPSRLDHFVCTKNLFNAFQRPKVLREYAISDHCLVIIAARQDLVFETVMEPRIVFDGKAMLDKRQKISSSNRWSLLGSDVSVDVLCDTFCSEADAILCEENIKTTTIPGVSKDPKMPRKLVKSLNAFKHLSKDFSLLKEKGDVSETFMAKYDRATFRSTKNAWEYKMCIREFTRVGEEMLSGDFKSAWNRVHKMTHEGEEGVGTPLKENQPMRDINGRLHTDPETVSKIMTEHYRSLHQDDPLRACHDDSWWTTTLPFLKEQIVDTEIAYDLCWREVLVVIRGMNRDTAPGLDELHINMFKGMVREESMAELQK